MLSVNEAQDRVLGCMIDARTEEIPILESTGRVLAENVISDDFIPAYDNSSVDGFAVKSVDILGADKNYPVKLRLTGDFAAGEKPGKDMDSGFCARIMTGAPVPAGSDCIVMKEDALREGKDVLVFKQCKSGENIRLKGEDILKGDTAIKKGKRINPGDIGVMASLGVMKVKVYRLPVVGVIVTGDELIPVSEKLKTGKVRDSNSYSLYSQISESGGSPILYGIVRDEKEILKKKIMQALAECDILILTGGISVGDHDLVKEVLSDIGAEFLFWRVNQHPGKPMAFLTYKGKRFIFGLPGNPVSVMVCFEIYVRPLIKKIMGEKRLFRDKITAIAKDDFAHREGSTNFMRVILEEIEGRTYFKPTGKQGSGILTSMSQADGLAVLPEDTGRIEKGSEIEVYLLK